MRALDTNVLRRQLAQDDAKHMARATRLFDQELSTAGCGCVSLVALLETVWVQESRHGADAARVAAILSDLLDTPTLEVQDAAAVRTALQSDCKGGADPHDCLIVALAAERKARVLTFDAKAAWKLGVDLLR